MFNIHGLQISEELLAVSTICAMSMIVNAYYCCCQLPDPPTRYSRTRRSS